MEILPHGWRDGVVEAWKPTSFRALGKTERSLEELVAKNPELLPLEPYRTGIRGPFQVFRRVHIEANGGREVVPDLVLLSQSGHVVVVEVRLGDSEELRDRQLAVRMIEYAAALGGCDEEEVLEAFRGESRATSWAGRVSELFPKAEEPGALAAELLRRLSEGELHLYLACDEAPEGLREMIAAVTGKRALGGYELHVAELCPHVSPRGPQEGLLLLPRQPVRTEIIARTAVTIRYDAEQPRPSVSVSTTPPEEMLEGLRGGRPPREHFAVAMRAYDTLAPALAQRLRLSDLRLTGTAPHFRQVRPDGWPYGIHYEMMDRSRYVAAELHLESNGVLPVRPFLKELPARLLGKLPTLEWSDNWSKGKGKLTMRCDVDRKPDEAGRMFERLIEHTFVLVDRELRALKVT